MAIQRIRAATLLLAVAATLASCASLPQQAEISDDDIAWALAGAGRVSAMAPASAVEDLTTLLQVSDDMRRFAREATQSASGIGDRTVALAAALQADDGRELHYDAAATLSAEQAFLQGRANCLSYTLLFVALAREVGIPARFNEVDIPPAWELGDDQTLLRYRHINARIELTPSRHQIVDIGGEDYSPRYEQRIISDAAALAQFYNNRAVELRLQRHHDEALAYQLRSLQLQPDAGYLWANLSGLYLIDGQLRAARIAITRALSLQPREAGSYNTAADIHARLGDTRLAAYFRKRAQDYLQQNPYYHFQLALNALQQGDDLRAYRETREAILLNQTDPRFFFLAAALLDRFGDTEHAEKIRQIALRLTPDPDQQARYRSKFERLSGAG